MHTDVFERDERIQQMSLTITDLEAGGKTPDQVLMDRAKAVGINPTGMAVDELEKKVAALESLSDEE